MFVKKIHQFLSIIKICTQKKIGSFFLPHGVVISRCRPHSIRERNSLTTFCAPAKTHCFLLAVAGGTAHVIYLLIYLGFSTRGISSQRRRSWPSVTTRGAESTDRVTRKDPREPGRRDGQNGHSLQLLALTLWTTVALQWAQNISREQ